MATQTKPTLAPTFDDEFNNGLSLWNGTSGTWQPAYSWSPNGYADSTMSSWMVNPNYGPTSQADADPYSVQNGVLNIAFEPTPADVSPSNVGGLSFISGQLTTKQSFSQEYGYFEMRAELPAAAGLNSAFWLLPSNGSWPPELDVEEVLGNDPTTLVMTAHSSNGSGGDNATPQWATIPDASQGYHTYAVDWEPNTVTWYFDGKQMAQIATPADWHQPMYVLLDTLSGTPGSWAGAPTPGESADMKIDYVRAYATNPYTNGATNPDWSSTAPPSGTSSGGSSGSGGSSSGSTPSPDNTVITAAAGGSITDASGNVWSIINGDVAVNGTPDGQSANVIELAYEKGFIWQENTAHMWWSKSSPSGTWGPTYGTATSPVPSGPSPWNDLSVVVPTAPASATAGKAAPISGISITDPWAATASGNMTLTVSDKTGSITIGGQTFGATGGTLTGTEAQLNADLAGLTYKATAAGTDTLTLGVTNQGGAEVTKTVALTVAPALGRHARQARAGALGRRLSRQRAVHREDGRHEAWRRAVGHGFAQRRPDADLHLLGKLGRRRAQRGDRLHQRRVCRPRQGPESVRQPGQLRRPRRDEPDGAAVR